MTLNKYIPPKNLHTPLPQKAMVQDGNNVTSQGVAFGVNPWASNLREIVTNSGVYDYVYVVDATNGDDANDGLFSSSPLKTIQEAINRTPTDLGGCTLRIYILPGTYTAISGSPLMNIVKSNGHISIVWAGAWAGSVGAGKDAYMTAIKSLVFDVKPTSNDPVILEANGSYCLYVNGSNSLTMSIFTTDMNVNTWNRNIYINKFAFKVNSASADIERLTRFVNVANIDLYGCYLEFITDKVTRNALSFEYCPIVTLTGFKASTSVLSGINTGDSEWIGLIHLRNSDLQMFYANTLHIDVVGNAPANVNLPIEVQGYRQVMSIMGKCGFLPNHVGKYVNYTQGLLPDANLPRIRIHSDVSNYSVSINENYATLYNISPYAGVILDALNSKVITKFTSNMSCDGDNAIVPISVITPADALLVAKQATFYYDSVGNKLKVKLKEGSSVVKIGAIDLAAPLEYTALISETGYAATSGLLVAGQTYYIASYVAGDDFTNVGGTNVTGNTFVASGTTPTTWTNSSILVSVGISAPAVTLLTNGLSGAIVWTYSAVGTYIGTLSGAFTENKTVFQYPPLGDDKAVTLEWTSANVITLKTYETGALKDGLLVKFPLTIKVYP